MGEEWSTQDCSRYCICEGHERVTCYDQVCHTDAFCGAQDGIHGCHCIDGHSGDGIDKCEGELRMYFTMKSCDLAAV